MITLFSDHEQIANNTSGLDVGPLQETLAKKQAALKAAQEALATVLAKVQALKDK
jgi:hypothetical protein